jgi:hypothetical protein
LGLEPVILPIVIMTNRRALEIMERFTAKHSRNGDYYLTSKITWGVPSDMGILPTGGIAYAKVTVRNGQTTKAIVTR